MAWRTTMGLRWRASVLGIFFENTLHGFTQALALKGKPLWPNS